MISQEQIARRNEVIGKLLDYAPGIPHLTAGKMLHTQYPDLFKSADNARQAVQVRTGNHGSYNRRTCENTQGQRYRQPFTGEAMPAPRPFWDATPFVLESEKFLAMADIHIPFHDPAAIQIAVKEARKAGCKDVVLLGDVLDHYQESSFCRVPDEATLTQELQDGANFFGWLRKQFPKGRLIYKEGNHDERWQVKVHKALPEAQRLLDKFTYDQMGLADLGYELVSDRRAIHAGYLNLLHGHELGKGAFNPVSASRLFELRAKECGIIGHWHQSTVQRSRTLRNRQIGCWSIGCLCHLSPQYNPFNNWQHGFAIVERTDSDGGFIVENKVIIGGRAV